MKKQQLKLLANMVSVYIMTDVLSLIESSGVVQIIIFSLLLWLVSLLLRPLLLLITLPINLLTLGIFSLVINTWMIMLTDRFIKGIHVPGFWIAFILAVMIMISNYALKKLLDEK
ncbi:membrane protein [Alkaliphilus metalliredigens QYMF]|uniref:Membrane protein n=1 Tax=Alkaliphilus metalliredigens (strain QYMF) TaxID=293826 RepID=A6TV17_ALKMQ|nr:phage holin family protein [Alkaliphilus metalliredigens]ABR50035.1 membrane protein [Alkaliphilus metalliredigens QYMF]